MAELARCPFCGYGHVRVTTSERRPFDRHEVWCVGCGASGPVAPDREEAGRLWNRRPAPPASEGGDG